ncbi:hypothetical protein LCGC14_0932090 [marine sediment metagenome]|uniref:SHSP domain-containing protein n=1 Tax=marine sediment metagenome TaxID=412755 RepID=A0A0F9RU88_9ZZZZ
MSDDFDEIIDEFKKMLNLDSDAFEVDFLFIPASDVDLDLGRDKKNIEGFKISYHFETGMEKPEIKIESNIDKSRIREYLKDIDLSKHLNLKNINNSKLIKEIDASKLSLDSYRQENDLYVLEPYTEITDEKDLSEIILEIPGMEEDNVSIDFSEEGRRIIFTAENKNRKYTKKIALLFKSSKRDYKLEVNNGLAILKVYKSDK